MARLSFETTSWTLVQAAADGPSLDHYSALNTLCQKYWQPVYAFIRTRGYDRETAQDLTQGFFAVLVEKNYVADADRARGRFRSFLLTAVKHFLANERDRAHALKRGGGRLQVPIDFDEADSWAIVEHATPDRVYERRWTLSLLDSVMAKLRAEFSVAGREHEFDRLAAFLNKDGHPERYETAAAELSMS